MEVLYIIYINFLQFTEAPINLVLFGFASNYESLYLKERFLSEKKTSI